MKYLISDKPNNQIIGKGYREKKGLGLWIYIDNDKEFNTAITQNKCITGIGVFCDVKNPKLSENDILNKLITLDSIDEIIEAYNSFTGSFLLIIELEGAQYILSDIFCQKRVFMCLKCESLLLSNSELLLGQLISGKNEIKQEKLDLLQKEDFKSKLEYWLCEDSEWDERFKALLPNHYLEMGKREFIRMKLPKLNIQSSSILQELLEKSISNCLDNLTRFQKYIALSGGRDSRLILALNHKLNDDNSTYFTFRRSGRHNFIDVMLAEFLAVILNLRYKRIIPPALSSEFHSRLSKNLLIWRNLSKTRNLAWFKNEFTNENININGDGGGLLRRLDEFPEIEKNFNKEYNPYQLKSTELFLNNWEKNALSYLKGQKIKISDLFYLEVRMGKWAAAGSHEMEIMECKEITPFANRNLIFQFINAKSSIDGKDIFQNIVREEIPISRIVPYNPPRIFKVIKALIKKMKV